ncbi:abscisic acid receptor PYL9-like [Triticum dicoccoides]|uniref:abscisic acid receptor PYL9-like n=1 Tax=Triticum dicoccoides TaxID=85692 RepID=UPI00188E2AEF|nr:abscisic acid receptor PYL9-like [Triticum dicoccoides]
MEPHMESALRQGLTEPERREVEGVVEEHHTFPGCTSGTCTSLVTQRVQAPLAAVWDIVRGFANPQCYKHFIKSCALAAGDGATVGSVREVTVVSGLPASTSTEPHGGRALESIPLPICVAFFSRAMVRHMTVVLMATCP